MLYSLNRMEEPGVWFNESAYYCACGSMELVTVPHAVYSDFKLLFSDASTTSGAYSNFAILR